MILCSSEIFIQDLHFYVSPRPIEAILKWTTLLDCIIITSSLSSTNALIINCKYLKENDSRMAKARLLSHSSPWWKLSLLELELRKSEFNGIKGGWTTMWSSFETAQSSIFLGQSFLRLQTLLRSEPNYSSIGSLPKNQYDCHPILITLLPPFFLFFLDWEWFPTPFCSHCGSSSV